MPYKKFKKAYKKKSLTTKVKKIITKMSELKHFTTEQSLPTVAAATIYTYGPTQGIVQGVGNDERIGDQIQLHKIKLHGYVFAAAVANANTKWRISVVYSSAQLNATTMNSSGLSFAALYLPDTYALNGICGVYDEKAVTVLSDQTLDHNSFVSTSQDIKSWSTDIYLKDQKFPYIEGASPFGKNKNLYVVVQAYTTAAPSNCGSFFFSMDLQYKDL